MFGKRRTLAASRTALRCRIQLSSQQSSSGVELLTLTSVSRWRTLSLPRGPPPTPRGSVRGPQPGGALGLVASSTSPRHQGAGLHHSAHLLACGPSSPASILQLQLPSLCPVHPSPWGRRGFGYRGFGDRVVQSTAVLQWWS